MTANDYEAIVRQVYPATSDIIIFGGEDQDPPQYGKVFISLKPTDASYLTSLTKSQIISDLKKYVIASVEPQIIDPSILFVEVTSKIYYNGGVTDQTAANIRDKVSGGVQSDLDTSDTLSITKIKKDTGKFAKGRPIGSKLTTGGQAEIRKALNDIIKVGGKSFSNEDIKKLVDMDLFPDDDQFRKAVDVVKKEPAFKNLTFVDARSLKSKADYYTDPLIRKKIKENYKKLKQENLAKLVFPDEPLTTSKSRLGIILSDMADKGEIERLAVGKASEERIGEFDPSPESEKKAKIGRKRRKKIDILGAKDYEKELFDFKKEVQAGLGLEKVKKGKFDPIDMGHQSSIKQLKALKQKLRPEDLSPQFYKANQLGIQKYEGGVKTLENSLDKKFYPEQKKLYNQAKKFVDVGQVHSELFFVYEFLTIDNVPAQVSVVPRCTSTTSKVNVP